MKWVQVNKKLAQITGRELRVEVLLNVLRDVSYRLGRKVTQTELSKVCGVTQGHMSNVVLGKQKASEEIYQRIADYLSEIDEESTYTAESLMGTAPETRQTSGYSTGVTLPALLGSTFVTLPEVSHIPCGGFDNITSEEVKEWHLVPKSLVGSAKIIVRAVGDSMSPYIIEGDLLMVEEVDVLDVQSDDVVIAEIEGEFSCKRISKSEDAIALLPDNPHYRPIFINGQTVRIVGRVVGLHRKV